MLEKCPLLAAYAAFTAVCRRYLAQGHEQGEKIQKSYAEAVDYCIAHNILRKFLRKHRAEVIGMLLAEFDAEKYEKTIRQEGLEEGIEQGIKQGLAQVIRGMVETIREFGSTKEEAVRRLVEKLNLSDEEAGRYVKQYWT